MLRTTNNDELNICGMSFARVKSGLDENQVVEYINKLVEQNNELTSKLEHLDSLIELAQKTVIEAEKQAESVKARMGEEANARSATIISEAGETARVQAEVIIKESEETAKVEAERIIESANEDAERTVSQRIAQAEQQANEIVKAAEQKEQDFKCRAEEEAIRIIAKAGQEAAEEKQRVKDEIEQLRISSKQVVVKELQENFQKTFHEFLSTIDDTKEIMPESNDSENSSLELQDHAINDSRTSEEIIDEPLSYPDVPAEDALSTQTIVDEMVERTDEEINDQSVLDKQIEEHSEVERSLLPGVPQDPSVTHIDEETTASEANIDEQTEVTENELQDTKSSSNKKKTGKKKDKGDLYQGTVELQIPPPIALDRLLTVHKELKEIPDIDVKDFKGSVDEGILIKLVLPKDIPLLKTLASLSGVKQVDDLGVDDEIQPGKKTIVIKTKS